MSKEAMKLALEALEVATTPLAKDRQEILRARAAIKEALAQPEQEPFCYHDGRNIVGKEYADHSDVFPLYTTPQPAVPDGKRLAKELDGVIADVEEGDGFDDVCLDTVKYVRDALLMAQPEQSQVEEMLRYEIDALEAKLAECRAQPEQEPLTDEQIAKEVEAELTHYWNGEYIDTTGARDQLTAFARAIEAKLKQRNT